MLFETPLLRDHETATAFHTRDYTDRRDGLQLENDHRPFGLGAAMSWVIAQFVAGFAAYAAGACPESVWPPYESTPTPRSAPRDDERAAGAVVAIVTSHASAALAEDEFSPSPAPAARHFNVHI